MLDFGKLNDVEFEYLSKDVMSKKLSVKLRRFAVGRDGGVDLKNDGGSVVVQVKHYAHSTVSALIAALKKEIPKVEKLAPKEYYVCCSNSLSHEKIDEIYGLFSQYMSSSANVVTGDELSDFLEDGANADILKKHYKLWITSTGVLESVLTGDIDVDCATAFADIQNDVKFFVETQAYGKALKCLDENGAIMIVGEPGAGKTTASKMLALNYIERGYRLRYTTNGADLAELKKSLSTDREAKEIILLDDCLGQAYFNMKETQAGELGSLVSYIGLCENKALVLNSRVTIYREAERKTPELVKRLDSGHCRLYVLDMSEMNELDRARILYNHLYFNELPPEYFAEIRKNRRYRRIIEHRNYNPRIIDFVCDRRRVAAIPAKDHYAFIKRNLDDPSEVWRDEYENRVSEIDRLLLTTLYSLTETSVDCDMLKRCFERRLVGRSDIDKTVDHFKQSLARLEKAFVKIVDFRGKRNVSVVNPSVNDFLDGYFKENAAGRQALIGDCVSVEQFARLLDKAEYEKKLGEAFRSLAALGFEYENEERKRFSIASGIAVSSAKAYEYSEYVREFVVSKYKNEYYEYSTHSIMSGLLKPDLAEFYGLKELLSDDDALGVMLQSYEPEAQFKIVAEMDFLFDGDGREHYVEIVSEILDCAVGEYSSNKAASDYDLDIRGIVERSYRVDADGDDYFDDYEAEREIEDEVWDRVYDEVQSMLDELPDDVRAAKKYENSVQVDIYDAGQLLNEYFCDTEKDYDYDEYADGDDDSDEIDRMFDGTDGSRS